MVLYNLFLSRWSVIELWRKQEYPEKKNLTFGKQSDTRYDLLERNLDQVYESHYACVFDHLVTKTPNLG